MDVSERVFLIEYQYGVLKITLIQQIVTSTVTYIKIENNTITLNRSIVKVI